MGARIRQRGGHKALWLLGAAGLSLGLAWWIHAGSGQTQESPLHAEQASRPRASLASDARPSLLEGAIASALQHAGDAPVSGEPMDEDELTGIRAELSALREELSALREQETRQEPAPATEEEAVEREREEVHASIEQFQHQLENEARDPTWAPDAEETLRAAFASDAVWEHSRASSIECQHTLCRVRALHDDSNAEMSALGALGRNGMFGSSEAFSERFEREDGSIETETYITRQGHELTRLMASK